MTVLHLISSNGYYGAENMLVALAAGLTRIGWRAVVGVFQDARALHIEVAEQAQRRGLPVELIPCGGRWDRRAVALLRKMLMNRSIEVLHTHGYKADIMARTAVWRRRCALVATCHNWPDRRLSMRAYAALDRLALRSFDAVGAASEPVAEILRRSGVPGARLMPNGVEMADFDRPRPTIRNLLPEGCDRLVGFVGRFVPDKGGALLLRCAKRILETCPRTAFVFVGDGPCRPEWENLSRTLGLERHVVFAGFRQDMAGVYASFDVLVLPSQVEATPMCLLEAMAARVPVVATRVGSVPKIVRPMVTGLLVDAGDENALGAAVARLLVDRHLALSLTEQGRAHVSSAFSSDAAAAAYAHLYDEALSRCRARTRGERL